MRSGPILAAVSDGSSLLVELRAAGADEGIGLFGVVDTGEFDATQPCGRRIAERRASCGTVIVLGTGGPESFSRVKRRAGGALREPHPRYHPIDDWSRRIAEALAARLRDAGHDCELALPTGRRPLNFRQLAEAAGLGVVSPVLGHLLHPRFGPWVSLRAALLVDGRPFGRVTTPALDFAPCCGCPRPCVTACPVAVYRDPARADHEGCARHRIGGGCDEGCAALHACPLGHEHRYSAEEERFRNRYALFTMRRWLGVGAWRLLPSRWRRR
ncbi:MAG: hypothetical protein U1F36_02815 [Planctomycetota bacterium]